MPGYQPPPVVRTAAAATGKLCCTGISVHCFITFRNVYVICQVFQKKFFWKWRVSGEQCVEVGGGGRPGERHLARMPWRIRLAAAAAAGSGGRYVITDNVRLSYGMATLWEVTVLTGSCAVATLTPPQSTLPLHVRTLLSCRFSDFSCDYCHFDYTSVYMTGGVSVG